MRVVVLLVPCVCICVGLFFVVACMSVLMYFCLRAGVCSIGLLLVCV